MHREEDYSQVLFCDSQAPKKPVRDERIGEKTSAERIQRK